MHIFLVSMFLWLSLATASSKSSLPSVEPAIFVAETCGLTFMGVGLSFGLSLLSCKGAAIVGSAVNPVREGKGLA